MENTSKALLIAAAVLIAIILIAFGIRVLNSPKDVVDDAQDIGGSIVSTIERVTASIEESFSPTHKEYGSTPESILGTGEGDSTVNNPGSKGEESDEGAGLYQLNDKFKKICRIF